MLTPHFADESVTLYHGDGLAVLRELPNQSVNCCVTSPPYFGLRDYGTEPTDWPEVVFTPVVGLPPLTIPPMTASLGLEPDPWAYVGHLVLIFREVKRVLADDGTFWLNIGDSYSFGSTPLHNTNTPNKNRDGSSDRTNETIGADLKPRQQNSGLPAKNLLGSPWRVALALQADGWLLRNDVIWSKPNAMPESVTDRLSARYEHVFLFSKSRRYWFDLDPIREPSVYSAGAPQLDWGRDTKEADVPGQSMRQHRSARAHGKASSAHLAPTGERHLNGDAERGKNPGDVWSIPTQPFSGAHYAVMPTALAERCVQAGCKPCGVVLDPFSGSGTTGLAAARHGHPFVGVDLNAGNLGLSLSTRLAQPGLPFGNEMPA